MILTIVQLTVLLSCSTITARRYLKKWRAYTSYNKNGRYYVLPDVPSFDPDGLWEYDGIRFSKHGNLKQTIVRFIDDAPEGMDASNISERLAFDAHSILSRLVRGAELRREKLAGRFVYFSAEPKKCAEQFTKRRTLSEKSKNILTDAIAVLVLVEKIKNPKLDLPRLAKKLGNKGVKVKTDQIRSLFLQYDLLKKNPNSRSSYH